MSIVSNYHIAFGTSKGLLFGNLVYLTSGEYDFKQKDEKRYEGSVVTYFIEFETNRFFVAIEN